MKARYRQVMDKSIAAMVSAIEIYNKPRFDYREESFCVLAINAWELLFKAKILHLAANKIAAICVYESKPLKDGTISKKKYRKMNRVGNPMTISMFSAHRVLTEDYGIKIDRVVLENLAAMTEIRDNSVHFLNSDLGLSLKVQEIGTAAVQNYLHLVNNWFAYPLSDYNFYLMPISFFRDFDTAKGITLNQQERKFIDYVKEAQDNDTDEGEFAVSLVIDLDFKRSKEAGAVAVNVTNDPKAAEVKLSEDHMLDKYPWDYSVLTTRLGKRYTNFIANKIFYDLKRELEKNQKYCMERYLDPRKKKGIAKKYYSPNIVKGFDAHYTKAV